MKIGIIGTGAVGGYYGGHLAQAGHDVIFFARGENLSVFREKGLTIDSEVGNFHVHSIFTDDYQSFSSVDLLLFCVKSNATKEVAEKLLPVLKHDSLILTLQNGVDNEEILEDLFGKNKILSAAAYIQATVKEPGIVKQIGVPPRLVIGALDESLTSKVEEIASLFNAANTQTLTSSNVLEMKWKKLLWNVTFNPLTALVESTVGAIFDDEGLNSTAKAICKEAIAVAREAGFGIDECYDEVVFKQGQFARNHHTSMLQDKLKGKEMEIESICGYIVKKAKKLKVDIPVLQTIYFLLKYQAHN